MIFNENGFPRPSGATDWLDSAHLAGLMAFVGHEKMPRLKLSKYVTYIDKGDDRQLVLRRCPEDSSGLDASNYKNCTRDQLIAYLAGVSCSDLPVVAYGLRLSAKERGYRAQNTEKDIPGSTKRFPDGADFLDPSHIGYMKICAGLKANWFEKAWMLARIKIASKLSPLKEPNNIIVMSIVYGYADILRKSNSQINQAVKNYWCENEGTWRGEPELAEMLIKKLEQA